MNSVVVKFATTQIPPLLAIYTFRSGKDHSIGLGRFILEFHGRFVGVDLFASFQRDTAVMFPKTQRLGRLKRCMFKHVPSICQQIRHQLKGLGTRRDGCTAVT